MNADLMRAPGLQAHAQQRMLVERPLELEMRDGVAWGRRVERVPRRVVAVAADRRFDPAGPGLRTASHERQILALERSLAHERLHPPVCLLRTRHDEQP